MVRAPSRFNMPSVLTSPRLLRLTFEWLHRHRDQRAIGVAAEVVVTIGGREDFRRLEGEVPPAMRERTRRLVENARFRLELKTLEAHAEDRNAFTAD
jgi:hypothetical protein